MIEQVKEHVKGLFDQGKISYFVGLKDENGNIVPHVFSTAQDLDQGFSLGDLCEPGDGRYALSRIAMTVIAKGAHREELELATKTQNGLYKKTEAQDLRLSARPKISVANFWATGPATRLVIPAEGGIQSSTNILDPGFRRGDGFETVISGQILRFFRGLIFQVRQRAWSTITSLRQHSLSGRPNHRRSEADWSI